MIALTDSRSRFSAMPKTGSLRPALTGNSSSSDAIACSQALDTRHAVADRQHGADVDRLRLAARTWAQACLQSLQDIFSCNCHLTSSQS